MVTKRFVRYGRILGLPRLWVLPALLVVAIPLLAAGHTLADATATVTNGNPQFSLDQINPGQSTTANFTVASDAGTAPGEGQPAPSITSEAFVANVDSQTTITGIGAWPGATVTVETKSATSWAFEVTGSFPAENAPVTVTVQAAANASNGAHPVSLGVSYVDTTAGEGAGNQDTENFDVEKLAVDIGGPPYVIIDNSPPLGAEPQSVYTVTVTGGVGPSYPVWAVSSNIAIASIHDNQPTLAVFGNGPEGPGAITCNATNSATHSSGVGYRHPYVQDEYVNVVNEAKIQQNGTAQMVGPIVDCTIAGQVMTVAEGTSYTTTVTEGLSIGGSTALDDFVSANIGASFSLSQGWSYTITAGITTPMVVGMDYQLQETPVMETLTGTGQAWGPEGVVQTAAWTDPQPNTAVLQVDTFPPLTP